MTDSPSAKPVHTVASWSLRIGVLLIIAGGCSSAETSAARVAERARGAPPAVAEVPAKPLPKLERKVLDAYFDTLTPSPDLTRERNEYILENKIKYQLSFEHEVDCRGEVCRAVFTFENAAKARELEQVQRPLGTDSAVFAMQIDLAKVYVTIFSTSSGSTLRELVAGSRVAKLSLD